MGSLDGLPQVRRKILFVDAFDSFTNSIIGMLEQCLGVDVTMVHIDDAGVDEHLGEVLRGFDAVVIGPGPGHPANKSDIGFIEKLWKLKDADMMPIFGVCLGFQSLCFAHGAEIKRLKSARHGIITNPVHQSTDIFAGVQSLEATQYHSLHASLGGIDDEGVHWDPSFQCPQLQPLAWDTSDESNGPILMGVRHTTKPFWGVQFHPESICTSQAGKDIVINWWRQALEWWSARRSKWAPSATRRVGGNSSGHGVLSYNRNDPRFARQLRCMTGSDDTFLRWGKYGSKNLKPTDLVEMLDLSGRDVILLDSQDHARGRYSILGLIVPGKTLKVEYKVSDKVLRYGNDSSQMFATAVPSIDEVWPILQETLDAHDPRQGRPSAMSTPGSDSVYTGLDKFVSGHVPDESPFWGGFMGYISYEAGLETIDVELNESSKTAGIPDVNFAFIHRSIVIDHKTSQVYVQSLLPGDWSWILDMGRMIDGHVSRLELTGQSGPKGSTTSQDVDDRMLTAVLDNAQVQKPTEKSYRGKVLECQSHLASGDSYELCLTDETEIRLPEGSNMDEWALYKRLRKNNSAPFGTFLRLANATIVGSSPERFLQWTRDGRCEFRPIKGTVKKGPGMTQEMAHSILGSSKERAENLMIVDLIRHDLSGVVGANNTWVSKLMVVEEYETVYQLVSVIEGQLPALEPARDVPRGIDVLKASLPPGSMTGAPKKRSCEILRDLERRPRSIYSGVLGYMDVGGSGDFSVVIRTAFRDTGRSSSRLPQDPAQALTTQKGDHYINGEDWGYPCKEVNSPVQPSGAMRTNGTSAGAHGNGISADGASSAELGLNGNQNPTTTIPKTDLNDGMFDEDSSGVRRNMEIWRLGAGGAVTIQSTDEGEFLEMETKSSSVLGALFPKRGP